MFHSFKENIWDAKKHPPNRSLTNCTTCKWTQFRNYIDLKDLCYNTCSYFGLSSFEIQNVWAKSIILWPVSSKVLLICLILTFPITTCLFPFNYAQTGEKSLKSFKQYRISKERKIILLPLLAQTGWEKYTHLGRRSVP